MTTVPSVNIRFSKPFNGTMARISKNPYPSFNELQTYRNRLARRWEQKGDDVLELVVEIVGFDWPFTEIVADVAGFGGGYSTPLTVGYTKDNIGAAFDTLTHELLHNYFAAVPKENWEEYVEYFAKYSQLTRNHVALHAIHFEVFRAQKRYAALKAERMRCERFPDYHQSWQLVDQLGSKNIIAMLQG